MNPKSKGPKGVRLSEEEVAALNALAAQSGLKISMLIRIAVERMLRQVNETGKLELTIGDAKAAHPSGKDSPDRRRSGGGEPDQVSRPTAA